MLPEGMFLFSVIFSNETSQDSNVTVSQFVDTFLSEPCPAPIMWLPLLHRMASVEHVYHPVQCDGCQVRNYSTHFFILQKHTRFLRFENGEHFSKTLMKNFLQNELEKNQLKRQGEATNFQVRSFTGFRYKCQRCPNYQLCQQCFWRGRTSGNHSNEHEMKEYSSYVRSGGRR